jgi:hypothetical protein
MGESFAHVANPFSKSNNNQQESSQPVKSWKLIKESRAKRMKNDVGF